MPPTRARNTVTAGLCPAKLGTFILVLLSATNVEASCEITPDSEGHVTVPDDWGGDGNIYYSFRQCQSLVSVTIPGTINNVSDSFHNCYNLKNVTIQQGNHTLRVSRSFTGAFNLTSIDLATSVNVTDDQSFSNCLGFALKLANGNNPRGRVQCVPTSNNTLIIPNGVVSIGLQNGGNLFCDSYMSLGPKVVVLPNTVTELGYYSFWNCNNLKTINLQFVKTVAVANFMMGSQFPGSAFGCFDSCSCGNTTQNQAIFQAGTNVDECQYVSLSPTTAQTTASTTAPTTAPTASSAVAVHAIFSSVFVLVVVAVLA